VRQATIGQIADHYGDLIGTLSKKPAIIGHSFGGLLTQILTGGEFVDIDAVGDRQQVFVGEAADHRRPRRAVGYQPTELVETGVRPPAGDQGPGPQEAGVLVTG